MVAWLKAFLSPLRVYAAGVLQKHDGRIDFRNGFVVSQVLDALGVERLTIDVEVANGTSSATPDTYAKRNGSGACSFTTVQATNFSFPAVVSRTRMVPLLWSYSADWANEPYNGWLTETSGTAMVNARVTGIELDAETLPHGAELVGLKVYVEPYADRGLAPLPATMPRIGIRRFIDDGSLVAEALVQPDESATIEDYTSPHHIEISVLPGSGLAVDRSTERLVLFIEGEKGTDSYGGLRVKSVELTYRIGGLT